MTRAALCDTILRIIHRDYGHPIEKLEEIRRLVDAVNKTSS